jgi:hypothetical protein
MYNWQQSFNPPGDNNEPLTSFVLKSLGAAAAAKGAELAAKHGPALIEKGSELADRVATAALPVVEEVAEKSTALAANLKEAVKKTFNDQSSNEQPIIVPTAATTETPVKPVRTGVIVDDAPTVNVHAEAEPKKAAAKKAKTAAKPATKAKSPVKKLKTPKR